VHQSDVGKVEFAWVDDLHGEDLMAGGEAAHRAFPGGLVAVRSAGR